MPQEYQISAICAMHSSVLWLSAPSTGSRLIPQDRVVGEPADDQRALRQGLDLFCHARLLRSAVIHHRRACPHAARFKTHRRATGQPARRDYEDGEPPLPAFGVAHHWLSPWL